MELPAGRKPAASNFTPLPVQDLSSDLSQDHGLPSGRNSGQLCRASPELPTGPAEAVTVTASQSSCLRRCGPAPTPHKLPAHKAPSQILLPAGSACDRAGQSRAIPLGRDGKNYPLPTGTEQSCQLPSSAWRGPRCYNTAPWGSLYQTTEVGSPTKLTCHPEAGNQQLHHPRLLVTVINIH